MKLFIDEDHFMVAVMNQIKNRERTTLNLKEVSKNLNELVGAFNNLSTATFSLGGQPQPVMSSEPQTLVRQHTWALYTCYALTKALEDDLQRKQETAEAVQSSLLSALEYLQRNLKCLADLLNLDVSSLLSFSL